MTDPAPLTKFERKILEYLFTHPGGATRYEVSNATNVHLATHAILDRFERRFWVRATLAGEHRIFRIATDGDAVMRRLLAQGEHK